MKDKFPLSIILDTFNYFYWTCLKVAPLYAVWVVQSEPNFSKAYPVDSSIARHNLLKTESGIGDLVEDRVVADIYGG